MKEVRVAVVGMGIGRANGVAFSQSPRGRVVALCDLDADKMDDFAKDLPGDVKKYTDYKEMCADSEIDAVFVGTPNQYHVPIALEAVKHDKHVMVTKPLADACAPARELVEAAESAGVVNMMSLSTRYSDSVRYLGRLAREAFFGDIYYARARSIRRSGIPDWSLGFIEAGGGAFRDMGVHFLDSVWWIMGMPKPVSVSGVAGAKFGRRGQGYWDYHAPKKDFYEKYAADDYGGGFIKFDNGAGLQIESFWACHNKDESQIEIFGTEAGATMYPLCLYRTVNQAPQDSTVKLPKGPSEWSNIAEHFFDCILDGTECGAPLRHGLIIQEMLEALLESSETGKEVRLGE